MSLSTYHKKRDFKVTAEPRGKEHARRSKGALKFVIQKHDASRLHYDFRLELDGVLKSWAVPKGPNLDPSKKSLAVHVEDHPMEYGEFEGVIPAGEYGGGTVLLWDRGVWEPLGDAREGYEKGKLHFKLEGHKLHGEWALVQMHGRFGDDGKNWLLMKVKDKYAGKKDILKEDWSVKTKRKIEAIAEDRDDVWAKDAKKTNALEGAKKSALPLKFSPQLAELVDHPPKGKDWVHEIKFDGYRLVCFVKSGRVHLYTRNGNDWTDKFPAIAKSLAKLKVDSAIVDGEAVVLDKEGKSDFQSLQAMLKDKEKATPVLYAFDLPFCDGADLRDTPLVDRKATLEKILKQSKLAPIINYSEHVVGDGDAVIDKACHMSLEGIISKKADAHYVSRRDPSWLKSKCQARQEFIIIGYTDPQRSRKGFGSLLLGVHNEDRKLVYAGRVGTGFDDKMLGDLHKQLTAIEQDDPPTDIAPPARERHNAHWVEPKLVCEVRFTGWTRDNVLRHPAFIALRSDKPVKQIKRELPKHTEDVVKPTKDGNTSRVKKSKAVPAKKASKKGTAQSEVKDEVAGIHLSHPDKVLYPEQGVTKFDVANYYEGVQKWMIPHVADRPLALVRCPAGQSQKCFFQRNWSNTLPDDVGKVDVSDTRKKEEHITIRDIKGVISLAQIGVLEIHTWGCHNDDVEHPDQLIFDLDPGPDVTWKQVIEGARLVRKALDKLKLPSFLKTSGGKGLHIVLPIKPTIEWDAAKSFCETIAHSLVEQSDLFVANMRKDLRGGKVYIDYHRNGRGATAIAPYSTRARTGAPVSMPISWEELGKLSSAAHFTVENALPYLEKRKSDPWKTFERSRIDLHKHLQ